MEKLKNQDIEDVAKREKELVQDLHDTRFNVEEWRNALHSLDDTFKTDMALLRLKQDKDIARLREKCINAKSKEEERNYKLIIIDTEIEFARQRREMQEQALSHKKVLRNEYSGLKKREYKIKAELSKINNFFTNRKEAKLVDFGNYLLSEERRQTIINEDNLTAVTDADIANFYAKRRKEKKEETKCL